MYDDKTIDTQTKDDWKIKDSLIIHENPYADYL